MRLVKLSMRRSFASLAVTPFALLVSAAAWSDESPGRTGAQWDDRHMQSNFARYLEGGAPRPAIQGVDRYHQLAQDPAPAPALQVPEMVLSISPHEWRPGPVSGGSSMAGPPFPAHPNASFSSSSSARATRSSGLSAAGSSNLRSSAASRRSQFGGRSR